MTAKKIGRGLLTALGLVLAAFFISPILILIVNSFKSLKDIYLDVLALPNRETFTASNYPQAYEKLDFFTSFGNSLAITVSAIVLLLIFCSMAAWVLARYKTKMSSFIFLLYAAATLIPFQCVMLPLIRFMDGLNLMNRPGLVFMYLGFGSSYHSAARFYQKCASGARGSGPHRRLQHGANLFPDRFSALENNSHHCGDSQCNVALERFSSASACHQ